MEIRWFGKPWGAAICKEKYREESPPVGRECVCGDEIEPEDRGVIMAAVGDIEGSFTTLIDGKSVTVVAEHIDCFLGSILPGHEILVTRKP